MVQNVLYASLRGYYTNNMLYLSTLVGKRIKGSEGNTVARLRDIVAVLEDQAVPGDHKGEQRTRLRVKGLLARTGRRRQPFFVPADIIGTMEETGVSLRSSKLDLQPFERRDGEVLLTRELWDKQIIDLETRRVVRVNDIVLDTEEPPSQEEGQAWYIAGVDIGVGALFRRIRLAKPVQSLTHKPIDAKVVKWSDMDLFSTNVPGSLQVQHERLATLHPVEIARITDAVSYHQGAEIISSLDDTLAADTMEEIAAERQTDIMELIPDDLAADIIEEMAPDEATDLLAELPEDQADALLDEMEEDRASDVRQLMRYPNHTAGRAMTTDFICVRPDMTVADVIDTNKPRFLSSDLIYYMYVTATEEDDTLVGVITVRDLLVQERDTPVGDFMLTDFLAVRPGEHEREVARKMAEYNLLALPVIDRNGLLLGVITVDDALDSLLPEGWKKHLPRIFS